jgi:amidase
MRGITRRVASGRRLVILGVLVGPWLSLGLGGQTTAAAMTSATTTYGPSRIIELHDGLTSSRTTRRQHLERRIDVIQHQEATINAFVDTELPNARNQASNRDAMYADQIVGVLDGVVVAVKDNIHTTSFRTTAGAKRLAAIPNPDIDAFVVTRLKTAGAIVVGTTNLDTYARGVRGLSEVAGQTSNPRDPAFNAGGSSAGSAAAVSANMVDVALGTDTCGSLRYPASSVGIFALRPTYGRVSRSGVVPLSPSQDTVGPMAAHPEDLRRVMSIIAAPDPADPATMSDVPTTSQIRHRRLGLLRGVGRPNPTIIAELKAAGFAIVDAGPAPSIAGVNLIELEFASSLQQYVAWRSAGGSSTGRQTWLTPAPSTARSSIEKARRRLGAQLADRLDELKLDALLIPTNQYAPVRLGQKQPSANCAFSAGSGMPALTIPDPSTGGLPPIGLDLLGRSGDDDVLITIADEVDRRRG